MTVMESSTVAVYFDIGYYSNIPALIYTSMIKHYAAKAYGEMEVSSPILDLDTRI
jgi:hypothetical protein